MTSGRNRAVTQIAAIFVIVMALTAGWLRWQAVRRTVVLESPDYASDTPSTVQPQHTSAEFDGQRALTLVEAQMAFGPRPTGSQSHQQVGDLIIQQLDQHGWGTEVQPFTYQGVEARNLVGKSGDSTSGRPILILGAHYDTRMRADQEPTRSQEPVPGANDGASGVAVLLELAFALDLDTMEGDVWLVFFDAEDNGRLDDWDWIVGSSYFAEHLLVEPEFVIVIDMVGDANQQFYYEGNSDQELSARLWTLAGELGYGDNFVQENRYTILDDHVPFAQKGIPAVDIIDFDYPYWHTTHDTLDKISADSLERVGRTLEVFLEDGHWVDTGQGVGGQ